MLQSIILWVVEVVSGLGYPGIVIMMFLESSFFPFPSEVVMVPAGYLSYTGEMHIGIVIACGIIGSILGALFNYYIAVTLGKKLLHKYEKYLFLNEEKFQKIEKYFQEHGEISTFVGRLIPLLRQYISFPAGVARMNIPKFVFYTGLGAGLWVTILAYIGYIVGDTQELIEQYVTESLLWIFGGIVIVVSLYVGVKKKKSSKQ